MLLSKTLKQYIPKHHIPICTCFTHFPGVPFHALAGEHVQLWHGAVASVLTGRSGTLINV